MKVGLKMQNSKSEIAARVTTIGYHWILSPELETTEDPPAAGLAPEPAAREAIRTPAESQLASPG